MTTSNKQTDTYTEEQDFSIVFQKHRNPSQLEVGQDAVFFVVNHGGENGPGRSNISVDLLTELNKSDESSPASSGYPGL